MSVGDYLVGLALFGLVAGAGGVVGWRVVTRRLAHLDALEGGLAGVLIGVAAFIGFHVLPLALGVLSQAAVLVVAVLAAVAAIALVRAPKAVGDEPPRPPSPPSRATSWMVAGGAGVLVAAAAAANVREWLSRPLTCVDSLTFHLPNAARWMETGSLWQIDQFIPLQAQGYYPNHGDVLLLGSMLPWDNDFFARVPMIALLGVFAVAIWAIGRELGAPPAARLVTAAALVTLPIFNRATIACAMPDVLLTAALGVSALFLLRYARTGRRSDLVVTGLGLGLALGTKWYGVPAAVVAIGVFTTARLLGRAGIRTAVLEGLALGGLTLAIGGIWLLRNLAEEGNPLFPLDTPLFDAPRDVVSEAVGFAIVDYVDDPGVLFGELPGEILDGLGLTVLPLALAAVVALAIAVAGRGNGRAAALALAAIGLAAAYAVTPNSALGLEGDPAEANFNTRYALPALIACAGAGMWAAGRSRAVASVLGLALGAAAVLELSTAFQPWSLRRVAIAAVALVLVAGAGALALRRRERRSSPLVAASLAVILLLGAAAYGWRVQDRLNAVRYADGSEPVLTRLAGLGGDGPLHVAIAGDWNARGLSPVWPSFGERIENRVSVIGYDAEGFLTNFGDRRSFTDALGRVDPDVLIVGRGLFPKPGVAPREELWARSTGYRAVARSDRLVLMSPPS